MTTATEHIDRKSLYTSLEARIDYLHRFLDFGEGTRPTVLAAPYTLDSRLTSTQRNR